MLHKSTFGKSEKNRGHIFNRNTIWENHRDQPSYTPVGWKGSTLKRTPTLIVQFHKQELRIRGLPSGARKISLGALGW